MEDFVMYMPWMFPFLWLFFFIIGVCITISPLMIWKHTKATSRKLDGLIFSIENKKI